MSNTINAIRGLLNLPDLHKFYAEAKLDDGRLVVTEADSMEVGVEVRVMTDEGTAEDLTDGEYTLEDGTKVVVSEGRISQLGDEEPATEEVVVEEASEDKEEMKDKDEEDYSKLRKELGRLGLSEGQQLDVMRAVLDALKGELAEAPVIEEEVEMSELKEFATEIQGALDHIVTRLSALESQPAESGLSYTPSPSPTRAPINLAGLTAKERAHAIIRNNSQH